MVAVTVYDGTYKRVGRLGDYTSVGYVHQHLGVGTGTLIVDEGAGGQPAAHLLNAATQVVPVVIDDGVQPWTGRVQHAELSGPPGLGVLTATLVDEFEHFRHILARPVPGSPLSDQTAAEYDVRTGPLVTVAKSYLADNVARFTDNPYAVVPVVGTDTSPTVTLRARMTPMDELLVPPCREHDYQLTARLWLPGWDQPPGLALTDPTIVFDVTPVHDAGRVLWTDRVGIDTRTVEVTHPTALEATVGLDGDGAARPFISVTPAEDRSSLGRYAYRETFIDAGSADTPDEIQQQAQQELTENTAGTAGIGIVVNDGAPFTFGRDYWCGSTVRARTGGLQVTDTIERVLISHTPREGRTVIPQIGAANADETPEQALIRAVAALQADLAQRNSRR
jgi:hypothetical protein